MRHALEHVLTCPSRDDAPVCALSGDRRVALPGQPRGFQRPLEILAAAAACLFLGAGLAVLVLDGLDREALQQHGHVRLVQPYHHGGQQ